MSTVEISFENLLVCGNGDDDDEDASGRLPMSRLGLDEHACVHGTIRLLIGGRAVPHMGFFGPDDVCLWDWLAHFHEVESAFRTQAEARVFVDAADQSEPAFVWERELETGFLTIAACEWSGGVADAQWQRTPFLVCDFLAAHAKFRFEAREFILREAPHCGQEWWNDWGGGRFENDVPPTV